MFNLHPPTALTVPNKSTSVKKEFREIILQKSIDGVWGCGMICSTLIDGWERQDETSYEFESK